VLGVLLTEHLNVVLKQGNCTFKLNNKSSLLVCTHMALCIEEKSPICTRSVSLLGVLFLLTFPGSEMMTGHYTHNTTGEIPSQRKGGGEDLV
jgi:hypothetical protein